MAGDNTLSATVTYLEMCSPPNAIPPPPPAIPHAIMQVHKPTVSFYRYLYNTIGEDYVWWERRALNDDDLHDIITADNVEIFVLYVEGAPAGYFELVTDHSKNEIELGYFGLLPEFVGRRLGPYLLRKAIDDAWSRGPTRMTVNTCTWDHPSALPNYQRAGFSPYDQKKIEIPDPHQAGYF